MQTDTDRAYDAFAKIKAEFPYGVLGAAEAAAVRNDLGISVFAVKQAILRHSLEDDLAHAEDLGDVMRLLRDIIKIITR